MQGLCQFVTIHGEMVLLKKYSSLNFAVAEETSDVYRSTLAAMKAIRGFQNASSTYNPLSFSSR
ncbi:hypothetical protein Dsin_022791 [Dipteronia sinensis]|uniref:Uncharacterized protein n=1 Tax=Dipteronia sinensis TaxID=43782 RepID=A0AAE0E094_9ROSI|nr:hypothetical protein Dsin_022791 [Dipteronia sinensis]